MPRCSGFLKCSSPRKGFHALLAQYGSLQDLKSQEMPLILTNNSGMHMLWSMCVLLLSYGWIFIPEARDVLSEEANALFDSAAPTDTHVASKQDYDAIELADESNGKRKSCIHNVKRHGRHTNSTKGLCRYVSSGIRGTRPGSRWM